MKFVELKTNLFKSGQLFESISKNKVSMNILNEIAETLVGKNTSEQLRFLAAAYPNQVSFSTSHSKKYLYYLSEPDGTMHYAVTFDEHKLNKAKYLH